MTHCRQSNCYSLTAKHSFRYYPHLQLLGIHLPVPDPLLTRLLRHKVFRLNPVPSDLRPPCHEPIPPARTKGKNQNTNDGKDVVRVTRRTDTGGWRDKGRKGKEAIDQEVEDREGQIRVERRGPIFCFVVLQVYETEADGGVDPGAWVSVKVDEKIVCWSSCGCC